MSLFLSKNIAFISNFTKCMNLKKSTVFTKRTYTNQLPLENVENVNTALPFQKMLNYRRDEANRSILVQVQSSQSYRELYNYCNSIGTVKNMLHYSTGVEPMHFIIVEFDKESDVKNTFNMCSHIDDQQVVPVQSQFLWFKACSKKQKFKHNKNAKLLVEKGNKAVSDEEIMETLRMAENASDQMITLHNLTKLNELGIRLRFMVAKQIEMAVSGLFPTAIALPFGSSVNGYGKMGCDLDLVLRLSDNSKLTTDESRLIYHCKAAMGSERTTSQRHMEAIGDLIQLFLPGCSQVRRILQARVPIIKYNQQLADVECDLSMTNLSGVYMSDFLHMMGSLDVRVRPLVFTIRKWAAEVGLTNSSPGRWISNFSLTLLVLSFLQYKNILPSLNTLVKMAESNDRFITEDGINGTFLRDPNRYLLLKPIENTENLESLLQQFFEYYSQFDFASKAICLNDAISISKPEHSSLYIVNPLERGLNVSKNVSMEELEKFIIEVRNAAWNMESTESKSLNWGILHLFSLKKKTAPVNNYFAKQSKMIEVSKLFEEDEDEYKNEQLAKEVQKIKRDTKAQIKKLEHSLSFNTEKSNR